MFLYALATPFFPSPFTSYNSSLHVTLEMSLNVVGMFEGVARCFHQVMQKGNSYHTALIYGSF